MDDLHDFLKTNFPSIKFEKSNTLIGDGLIDSLDLFKIVSALEEKYNISIPFEDITIENFNSLELISSLIKKLRNI